MEYEENYFHESLIKESKHGNAVQLYRVCAPEQKYFYNIGSLSLSLEEQQYLNEFDPNTTNVVIRFKDPETQIIDKHPKFAGKLSEFLKKRHMTNVTEGFVIYRVYKDGNEAK